MRPWQPVLRGLERERAVARLDRIAAALRAGAGSETDASLPSGSAGSAVFFVYRELAGLATDDDRAALDRLLDRAAAQLAEQPMAEGLLGGFAGVAWLYDHIDDLAADTGDSDPDGDDAAGEDGNAAVDDALLELLAASPWRRDYDLVSGLTGIGLYGLGRGTRGHGAAIVEKIIAQLAASAEQTDAGVTWHTPPELLPAWQRARAPAGYHNLGLAHGVPGPIGMLAEAMLRGHGYGPARELLERAVHWQRLQALPPPAPAHYAAWLAEGEPRTPARAAWCYGDPGVAAALYKAGRALDDDELEAYAAGLAKRAVSRTDPGVGVNDAGLCHGAAGLAQISMRFSHATGDPAFIEAARRWLTWVLEHDRPDGIGGVTAFRPADDPPHVADASLLTGAAGVGLTLLAAVSEVEPGWDRPLLIDLA
jgi:hypothetical protein